MTNFQFKALPANEFEPLFKLSDDELLKRNIKHFIADANPGYPCRVSLRDADVGERVLVLSFTHHEVNTPYHSSGPIFVRENAVEAKLDPNQVPEFLLHRLLSARGYTADGIMITAEVLPGAQLTDYIHTTFQNNQVHYLHVHNAKPGCYSCAVVRA